MTTPAAVGGRALRPASVGSEAGLPPLPAAEVEPVVDRLDLVAASDETTLVRIAGHGFLPAGSCVLQGRLGSVTWEARPLPGSVVSDDEWALGYGVPASLLRRAPDALRLEWTGGTLELPCSELGRSKRRRLERPALPPGLEPTAGPVRTGRYDPAAPARPRRHVAIGVLAWVALLAQFGYQVSRYLPDSWRTDVAAILLGIPLLLVLSRGWVRWNRRIHWKHPLRRARAVEREIAYERDTLGRRIACALRDRFRARRVAIRLDADAGVKHYEPAEA